MGSFASTCCVSGLPIEYGDEVRWLLLTENPYFDGGFVCEATGRWSPRTWPIKARYNDYGSIEHYEEGPMLDVIMKGFQKDLVEVGVGDNSFHDVAAKRDMPFTDLLEAVWEGRMRVWNDTSRKALTPEELAESKEKYSAPYVPTMRRVEEMLTEVDKPEKGRFLVDDGVAWVRVRWDGLRSDYGKDVDYLTKAKAVLEKKYAVAMTAGGGSYANNAELRIFAAPGVDEKNFPHRAHDGSEPRRSKPLLVQQAMIREDVWQALVALPLSWGWKEEKKTVEDFRAGVKAFMGRQLEMRAKAAERLAAVTKLAEERSKLVEGDELSKKYRDELFELTSGDMLDRQTLEGESFDTPGAVLLFKDVIPFVVGLSSHANLLINMGHDFTDTAAEFAFIWNHLSTVRYVWRPSDTAGPQFGDWKAHIAYHKALAKAATAAKKNRERD
jgi:hypothetical protein